MKLYTTEDYEGYDIKDIRKFLSGKERKRFDEFITGQTGGLLDGKFIVYKWDWERFCSSKPVID